MLALWVIHVTGKFSTPWTYMLNLSSVLLLKVILQWTWTIWVNPFAEKQARIFVSNRTGQELPDARGNMSQGGDKQVQSLVTTNYRCRRRGDCFGHHGGFEASLASGIPRHRHCIGLIGSLNAHGRGNVYEDDHIRFVEEPTSIPRNSELPGKHQGQWSNSERKKMTPKHTSSRRLIEEWLPISEISIEAIRERSAASALPPVNWLHVWWARRPLTVSRAAVAASLLLADSASENFYNLMGTHSGIVQEQRELDIAKETGEKLEQAYSQKRAFTHNLTPDEANWLTENLAVPDPLVVDITAGGGSIPFEAGRLGLRSVANELNPVAALILRATCQWPQQYGYDLLDTYNAVSTLFRVRVHELLEGVYPPEPQLSEAEKLKAFETDARPKGRPNVPLGARRFLSLL